MSDLGGRASNGGARTGGPVPIAPTGTPSGIRTPRDVMRDRNAREARRQEEQKAEEARRLAEDRRRSAERRATAVTGGSSRLSQPSSQYQQEIPGQQGGFEGGRTGSGRVSGADVLGEPVGRTQEYPTSRRRGSSATQPEQPRPAQPAASGARRSQQSQGAPRQPSSQTAGGASSSRPQQGPDDPVQRATASSFPHAFERWETLSSHWEGLTSYWLHKLEQNTEEIRNTIPNASTLNRQITDLSAAGANLFHAVVELQRLRASSERKFQRWFFETRADTERNSEMQGQMERQLRLERSAREEAATKRAEAEDAAAVARREVVEMRRELMISKEEARRAWEELGRRSEEEIKNANLLKAGQVATVANVQVVPYFGGPSRSGTGGSQRPVTREGQPQYGSAMGASSAGAAGLASPGDDPAYYREEPSPTNTDPFTEQRHPPLHHEPDKPSLAAGTYRPYPVGGAQTASGAPQQTVMPMEGQRARPASTGVPTDIPGSDAEAGFYQHTPSETFLHSPQSSSHAVGRVPPPQRADVRSEASYADTLSEGDTEYVIDAAGNVRHDEQGHPIPFRQRVRSEASDEYDEEAIRHERELAARYGSQAGYGGQPDVLPEAPSVPTTSAQAMATYTPTSGASGQPGRPDYEGQGYGGWDALQTRHHHPTRLSDVLEEEEERSSRRTGD